MQTWFIPSKRWASSACHREGSKRGSLISGERGKRLDKPEILTPWLGRTPKGAYSRRGRSRHLLETPFSEPLLRTLLRTPFQCKTHSKPPSQNPSENPSPEPFPEPSQKPFLERCVAVRPLRRALNWLPKSSPTYVLAILALFCQSLDMWGLSNVCLLQD